MKTQKRAKTEHLGKEPLLGRDPFTFVIGMSIGLITLFWRTIIRRDR